MEIHYTASVFSVAQSGDAMFMITIPKDQKSLYDKIRGFEDDKQKVMTIDYYKEKRSLNANSMMWSLLNKLAAKLDTTDEELYIDYLRKYAPKDYMAAPAEAEEIFKTLYKIVEPIKDCTINETPAVTFRCIRGSSKFNSKEFSVLLDHVVQDCKEQGIETLEDKRINEIVERWKPE